MLECGIRNFLYSENCLGECECLYLLFEDIVMCLHMKMMTLELMYGYEIFFKG